MTYERDQLGFVAERCEYCNARLFLSDEAEAKGRLPICLNACHLTVGQKRIMDEGLRQAAAEIDTKNE